MAATVAAAVTATALSAPLKDLYETGKDQFKDKLSKWNNSRNVKTLTNKVAAYEQVKTIWQREKKVKLSNFYYPSKVTFETGNTKPVLSLRDLPSSGGLVIQGTVGQGKSIFLRYLCIQELSNHSSQRIPVFFELRKLDENLSLEKALLDTLECLGFEISDELFEYYAESGKLIILLDGFDELEENLVNKVVTTLEFWAVRYPKMQFIITSRPDGEIQKSNHFSVIRLAPLGPDDHKPFMVKIGLKGSTLEHLTNAIAASPNEIRGLLTTPLLLTLLVLVYQSEGIIPNELPEFFKLLFTTVFVKHDRTKPAFSRKLKSGLNDQKLEHFFEAFCFSVMRRKFTVNLKAEQFQTAYNDALKFSGENCTFEGFKYDIAKVACLLQEDGLYTSFAHKSLLDYYPAAFIRSCTDEQSSKIYNAINPHYVQWQHVLNFLSYIDRYRFAKYFAIPSIEHFLNLYGIKDTVSEKNVSDLIDGMFDKNTCFRFSYSAEENVYRQRGFGPYHPYENYFVDSSESTISLIHKISALPKLEGTYKEQVENGEKLFYVYWKDACSTEFQDELRLSLKNYLVKQIRLYDEFKNYIAEESKKADLLAQLEFN